MLHVFCRRILQEILNKLQFRKINEVITVSIKIVKPTEKDFKSFVDIISKVVGRMMNISRSVSSLRLVIDVLWKIG